MSTAGMRAGVAHGTALGGSGINGGGVVHSSGYEAVFDKLGGWEQFNVVVEDT